MKAVLQWVSKHIRLIIALVVIIALALIAANSNLNLGAIIDWILKRKPKGITPTVSDPTGKVSGTAVAIVQDSSPLRNKSQLHLENGTVINLPRGIQDNAVTNVIQVNTSAYHVVVNSSSLTDVFDKSVGTGIGKTSSGPAT